MADEIDNYRQRFIDATPSAAAPNAFSPPDSANDIRRELGQSKGSPSEPPVEQPLPQRAERPPIAMPERRIYVPPPPGTGDYLLRATNSHIYWTPVEPC